MVHFNTGQVLCFSETISKRIPVLHLPVNAYKTALNSGPGRAKSGKSTTANCALCRALGMIVVITSEASCLACEEMCMKRAIPRKLLRWEQTGSTNFDYVDHVSDSVDVLPSTRGAEIVGRVSEDVWMDDTDVLEGPSDVK